ncbi:hypothetical protein G1H11_04875 [Phytoactinopolyspora alkaliphila]|uniref:Uncharacterized protein n=1 Tax=Phytoactinopolyspora alkaliphila TaxID=1783498 RepID=A0A6N9YID9_9ACTN|nr:hypothetical protein [Phytoactinopolyspora alkaliphila]NED94639.1 hypothetical protein [Phytoactinopolyspora alkaliphila]
MGYSGLIYAAIVAAWLAVLVPRWVRRNEEVERARETDAVNGVRVLRPRSGPIHAPHRLGVDSQTIISADASGMVPVSTGKARPARSAAAEGARTDVSDVANHTTDRSDRLESELRRMNRAFAAAARRRRLILSILLLTTISVTAGTLLGPVPSSAAVASGLALAGFLVVARRAAVQQASRRADLRRRLVRERAAESAETPVEAASPAVTEDGKRVAVLDVPDVAAPPAEDTWEPVDVPLPTYVTAPKAPRRIVRKIELNQEGSWTSGRLEPDKSFDLPTHRPSAPAASATGTGASAAEAQSGDDAEAEEMPETRRAVGE